MSGTGVEDMSSRGYEGGIAMEFLGDFLMRSATMLVMAEKAGGDSVHPIGSRVGMSTSGGSPGKFGNGPMV